MQVAGEGVVDDVEKMAAVDLCEGGGGGGGIGVRLLEGLRPCTG